ncbi:tautomerase family protein [Brevibacillus sp. NRS-1366]|uniref:tautomerase family protein n=1 Tax=Brevibacillus sp. NRS-1366 TaxID=3233899 RepID=UPI003D20EA51
MAVIHMHILEGRNQEVKTRLIAEVTDAVSRTLQSSPDWILVMLHEISKDNTNAGGKTPGRGQNDE